MKVSDRHDDETISVGTIQEAIRESRNQDSAESTTERMAAFGESHQSLIRALDRENEVDA
jgi:hypothetical protein